MTMNYNIERIISNAESLRDIQRAVSIAQLQPEQYSNNDLRNWITAKVKTNRDIREEFSSKMTDITDSWHNFCLSLGGHSGTTTEYFSPLSEESAEMWMYIPINRVETQIEYAIGDHLDYIKINEIKNKIVRWNETLLSTQNCDLDIECFQITDEIGISFDVYRVFDILAYFKK